MVYILESSRTQGFLSFQGVQKAISNHATSKCTKCNRAPCAKPDNWELWTVLPVESAQVSFFVRWKDLRQWLELGTLGIGDGFSAHIEVELNIEINIGQVRILSQIDEWETPWEPWAKENGLSAEIWLSLNIQNTMEATFTKKVSEANRQKFCSLLTLYKRGTENLFYRCLTQRFSMSKK